MKLLLDQNLSRRLVGMLESEFPGTAHVLLLGKEQDDDGDIWTFAAANDYAIVSKDKDFYQRSVVSGHPPKVIHLTLGNCSVDDIAAALLNRPGQVKDFLKHESKSYLVFPQPS
ncbi:MAG: DUF5615 family PIN-like protein [Verrucomicrobiales bacterium]